MIHFERSLIINQFYVPHFDYQEFGIKGVGKNRIPILSMDQYIDSSQDEELHIECCKGLALSNNYKMGMIYGSVPPEINAEFNGKDCWTEMLKNLKEHDSTGIHRKTIEEIIDTTDKDLIMQTVYKYCYYALGSIIPWYFALYLKKTSFSKKTEPNENYLEDCKYFPKLMKYIDTLPFKHIGRILFFTTYPKAGVITHRDSVVSNHKDHNINLYFSAGWRPSYVWNELTKEKIYLEKGARSYFFNNRDYHGVDPEPVFRYTLRIDGTFTDELCDKLGLVDGYTWHENYSKDSK
jgi:hypothetical protein